MSSKKFDIQSWRNLLAFQRDPVAFVQAQAKRNGKFSQFKIGPQQMFLLNDPDYIKDVLVTRNQNFGRGRGIILLRRLMGNGILTSEGDFHLRQRRLVQPAFHRQRIAGYAAMMVEYAARARERWHDGQTMELAQEMMRLTLAVVGKTLFDAEMEGEATEIRDALDTMGHVFQSNPTPLQTLLAKLPFNRNDQRFEAAKARLDAIIYRIIDERRASHEDRGDLLSMLLATQDTEGDGKGMTNEQVRDEAMTLFLAGHDTTSNALSWTWYLLAQYPQVEAKLHAELDTILQGRLPTFEDLPKLKYTEAVLTEAMRMYPPAWTVGRRVLKDYQVDGHTIPANSFVLTSQYVMHHNPLYFHDPETFKPERWTPEFRATLPKFAYFPFGGGPRLCIGEAFAWTEGELLIATLAQKWRFHLLPGQKVEMKALVTLKPKNGIQMRLEQRQTNFVASAQTSDEKVLA